MKKFQSVAVAITAVLAVANLMGVIFFWWFVRGIEEKGVITFDFAQFLAFQSNQYSILQVYFVIFSIVFAILGFLGFAHIKEEAVVMAKKAAEAEAKALVENFLKAREQQLNLGAGSFPFTKDE